jgi:T5SS/PEP-CTERM-associated repeat protein
MGGDRLKLWPGGSVNQSGGTLTAAELVVDGGAYVHTGGQAFITTDTSTASASGLYIGAGSESGSMSIGNGGSVTSIAGFVGSGSGSAGSVIITGTGSNWTNEKNLTIGNSGAGTLVVQSGGSVSSATGTINTGMTTMGEVTITGAGSTWTNSGAVSVGYRGTGVLTIADGGNVTSSIAYVGGMWTGSPVFGTQGTGRVIVTGAGSSWTSSNLLRVGEFGIGELTILDGGSVFSGQSRIAVGEFSTGNVIVSGAGSAWTISGGEFAPILAVGESGTGTLTIEAGGSVSSSSGRIGWLDGSTGTVNVTGAGSTWTNIGALTIGQQGHGTLLVSNGGLVVTTSAYAGSIGSASTGAISVTGTGSAWMSSGIMYFNRGTLTIQDDGLVTIGGDMRLTNSPSDSATVNLDGGTLDLQGNDVVFGDGTAVFNVAGGTLRHVGTFGSSLHQQGGHLEIGASAGTMAIAGDYHIDGGAAVGIELGGLAAGTQHDQLNVIGQVSFNGALAVSLIDGFVPRPGDAFVVMTYGSGSGQITIDNQTGYAGLSLSPQQGANALTLVAEALNGDANLDGAVTIADLGILAANWQQSDRSWLEGDFTGDGMVTIADLGILAANWQRGVGASGGGDGLSLEAAMGLFDVFSGVEVPEPVSVGLFGAAFMLIKRRSRRSR